MSQRQLILTEVVRRLEADETTFGKRLRVKRGTSGAGVTEFPSLYLWEDDEQVQGVRSGLYEKRLPIQVEAYAKVSDPETAYEVGGVILADLTAALELDERLEQGGSGLNPPGTNDLVSEYGMTRNQIVQLRDGAVVVILNYQLTYHEPKAGYEAGRR